MLTLYTHPQSTHGQKVHFFLEEAAIPYTYKRVELGKGEQGQAAFLALNPFGKVPTIDHDGFGLGESAAILRYVAQQFGKTDWYPENPRDRARVDQVCEFTSLHINRYLGSLAWSLEWAVKWGRKPDLGPVAEARENLLKNMVKLEAWLAQAPSFLVGPTPTLADAMLLPFLADHASARVSLSDFPGCRRWLERMTALAGWKKVAAAMAGR